MFWSRRHHFELRDWGEHIHFQVVTAYDVVGAPDWRIETPVQPMNELWLVRAGAVEIVQNQRQTRVSSGEAALLLEGQSRATHEIGGQPLAIIGFNFHATLLGALPFAELLELPPRLQFDTTRLGELLDQIVLESREKQAGYAIAIHGLAQLAFLEFWRAAKPDENWLERANSRWNLAQNSELTGALALVAANFDQPLDVASLAQAAHLSPKHFARKFRAALGMTPMDYVRRYRWIMCVATVWPAPAICWPKLNRLARLRPLVDSATPPIFRALLSRSLAWRRSNFAAKSAKLAPDAP